MKTNRSMFSLHRDYWYEPILMYSCTRCQARQMHRYLARVVDFRRVRTGDGVRAALERERPRHQQDPVPF